jgi:hypothetical protein
MDLPRYGSALPTFHESIGGVWFATRRTLHDFCRFRFWDDRGTLEFTRQGLRFVGNRRFVDCLAIERVSLTWQTPLVVAIAFANVVLLGLIYGGRMSFFTAENPASLYFFFSLNAFYFLQGGPFRWVKVEYVDDLGQRQQAFFTDGRWGGLGRLAGGTRRLYEAIQAHAKGTSDSPKSEKGHA